MPDVLQEAVAEIEAHVHAAGWDRGPALFALVSAGRFSADQPGTAQRLGIADQPPNALTPVEQADLPEGALDEILAGIEWPESVVGCAVTQEIVVLPSSAEAQVGEDADVADVAAHPQRREARLAVGVLRDGASASLLRLRGTSDSADERVTGPDLAPNLVEALLATLR